MRYATLFFYNENMVYFYSKIIETAQSSVDEVNVQLFTHLDCLKLGFPICFDCL